MIRVRLERRITNTFHFPFEATHRAGLRLTDGIRPGKKNKIVVTAPECVMLISVMM